MYKVYVRKLGHMLTAAAAFLLPYYFDPKTIVGFCGIFVILLIIWRYLGLAKHHDVDRNTMGEFYFPLGIALSAFMFLPQDQLAFQFGILVLGLADIAAELIGKHFGRHKIGLFNKTWQGSTAFFIVSFLIYFFFIIPAGHGTIYEGLIISLTLTIAETLASLGLDNLILPILGAGLIKFFA